MEPKHAYCIESRKNEMMIIYYDELAVSKSWVTPLRYRHTAEYQEVIDPFIRTLHCLACPISLRTANLLLDLTFLDSLIFPYSVVLFDQTFY